MTVGEYDDAYEYSEGCDDFHRRRCDVVEYIVEYKTCERKCELKNSGDSCGYIFETFEVEPRGENIGDKNQEKDIERIYADFFDYCSDPNHLVTKKYYHPTNKARKEVSESEGIEM